jgi:parallel beta-helix repeat protein
MSVSRRSMIAVAVVLLVSGLVLLAYWYEGRQAAPGPAADGLTINVTNGGDRGPGTLREALFIAASADGKATISVDVPKVTLTTALPPLVSARGIRIVGGKPGVEIDARGLPGGAVLDVAGAGIAVEGIAVRNCSGAGILLRAARFRLQSAAFEGCDVGLEIAENATGMLIEGSRFSGNRVGLRFAASIRDSAVLGNQFTSHKDAAIWAVRSEPALGDAVVAVRGNRFQGERIGVLAGNVSVLIERNEFKDSREAAVHLIGAGAVVRGNRIDGGAAMGIVAESARSAVIEGNEIARLTAYGIMIKSSANTLVRGNRVHDTGYGMAFVLGDETSPSTAVENTIMGPKYNGIDVIGDSPILRRNHVLRPRAMALHIEDFSAADGRRIRAKPFLDNNNFGTGAAGGTGNTARTDAAGGGVPR